MDVRLRQPFQRKSNEYDNVDEHETRTGARMNTPIKGVLGSSRPSIERGASKDSTLAR